MLPLLLATGLAVAPLSWGWIYLNQTANALILSNDYVSFYLNKTDGEIHNVTFQGTNVLGFPVPNPPAGGDAVGPYVDIYIPPANSQYTPGSMNASLRLINGTDSAGTPWGALIMSQPNAQGVIGATIEQYLFLRANETLLHAFSRFAYHNSTTPLLGEFLQLRTLFRPHFPLDNYFYTHLSASDDLYVPQPRPNPAIDANIDLSIQTQVQDTTWYIGNRTGDPYVANVADYWTKYTMNEAYRNHTVHGLFADGTGTPGNVTYGAWTIFNSRDTYYGGPTYADLTVDGLMYNYIISNHFGNGVPNITDGYDRTFGPALFYLNKGSTGGASELATLRAQASQYADTSFGAQFYDDIAQYVPGYVTTAERGKWEATIKVPSGAANPIAVLSAPGLDFQDNSANAEAYQYWAEIPSNGNVAISRVKAGDYQLTVYADGIFGDFIYSKNITVTAGQTTQSGTITWNAASNGKELWRLGLPDKSAGEYRHGNAPDPNHPLHLEQRRIYWGAYDFINDFPNGVNFKINQSSVSTDFNYIHWSSFGGSLTRPNLTSGAGINNWTVSFDLTAAELKNTSTATLTIQLAGVTTAAGNTDTYSNTTKNSNLPYNVIMNGQALPTWTIPYYHSSSCAIRSAISCYHISNSFSFPTSYLSSNQTNSMVLSLPFNGTIGISVMYDALRLEVK